MNIRKFGLLLALISAFAVAPAGAQQFKVGFGRHEITPQKPMPMWGYAARRDIKGTESLDSMFAQAVVIDTGDHKLAIMGLDMGRGPRPSSMKRIRAEVLAKSGVDFVMISGSHTHHGPVLELQDIDGKGKGRYDDAVAYVTEFEDGLIAAINEAAANTKDAKWGWDSVRVPLNRNRHTKFTPKPVDDELSVLRFDDLAGKPIALVINYAAHPTILPALMLKYSSEWPGRMKKEIEERFGAPCVYMQGSAGDMSPNTTQLTDAVMADMMKADKEAVAAGKAPVGLPLKYVQEMIAHDAAKAAATPLPAGQKEPPTPQYQDIYQCYAFAHQMADEVVKLAPTITTKVPEKPSIQGMDEDFDFTTRLDINDKKIKTKFEFAFFQALVANFAEEIGDGHIHPHLTTILVNGELGLVGGSGEFFSDHSNRLKKRSRLPKTLFFGYCNGHHMYFPTIEAAAEGGYGGDPTVSWVEVGGPEKMMDKALINLYTMQGMYIFKGI